MNEIIVIIILLVKNVLMLIILLCLAKLRQILNCLNLKLVIESELQCARIFLANVTPKIG